MIREVSLSRCGKATETWYHLPNCDSTVGHHDSGNICDECYQSYSNRCGLCGEGERMLPIMEDQ